MRLNLEILSCSVIKRKKSCRKISWLGKDSNINDVIVIDDGKISMLNLSMGQTKGISKLQSFRSEIKAFNICPEGQHVGGILDNGKVFLWDPSKNVISWIPDCSLSKAVSLCSADNGDIRIFISKEAKTVLLIISSDIFYWKCSSDASAAQNVLQGDWFYVESSEDVILPPKNSFETEITAVFNHNWILNTCVNCSFVFILGSDICVTTALIQLINGNSLIPHSFTVSYGTHMNTAMWGMLKIPIKNLSPKFPLFPEKGIFVAKYSHDGDVMALTVNTQSSSSTKIIFVSPITQVTLCVDLKDYASTSKKGEMRSTRHHWIADIEWTSDNAYVVGVTCLGLFFMISRLGSLIMLQTEGCSMDMGPLTFLPIHPLVTTGSGACADHTSQSAQKFSVSCHPLYPNILVSDGFLVSCIEIPAGSFGIPRLVTKLQQDIRQALASSPKPNRNFNASQLTLLRDLSLQRPLFSNTTSHETSSLHAEESEETSEMLMNNQADYSDLFQSPAWEDVSINDGLRAFFAAWGLLGSKISNWTSLELSQLVSALANDFVDVAIRIISTNQAFSWDNVNNIIGENEIFIPLYHFYSPNVACLANVMNLLIQYLKFDSISGHLLVPVLNIVNKVIKLLFSMRWIKDNVQNNIALLKVGFDILCGFEKAIYVIYSYKHAMMHSVPLEDEEIDLRSDFFLPYVLQQFCSKSRNPNLKIDSAAGVGLLYQSWRLLCMHATQLFHSSSKYLSSDDDLDELMMDICDLQKVVQNKGLNLQIFRSKIKLSENKHSVIIKKAMYGKYEALSFNTLKRILAPNSENSKISISCYLHSLLYGMLFCGRVRDALDFIMSLLSGLELNIGKQSEFGVKQSIEPLQLLVHRPVLSTIRSFARFFAAYFTNQPLRIYPFHHPKSLPSLLRPHRADSRMLTVVPVDITNSISANRLGNILCPDLVLELLLLSGLWEEAIWFTQHLGDTKASLVISSIWNCWNKISSLKYQERNEYEIPDKLLVAMMKDSLDLQISTNEEQLSRKFESSLSSNWNHEAVVKKEKELQQTFLNVAAICDLDPIPLAFEEAVIYLKNMVTGQPFVLGTEIMVPTSLVFSSQPDYVKDKMSENVKGQITFRNEVSALIQRVLLILRSANLPAFLLKNYVNMLRCHFEDLGLPLQSMRELLNICIDLPEEEFDKASSSFKEIFITFCELCSVLWMLYVQDQLVNAYWTLNDRMMLPKPFDEQDNSVYFIPCSEVIRWAAHLMPLQNEPYSKELLINVVLNAAMDAEPCLEVVVLVSKAFLFDPDLLHASKDRLNAINETWRLKMTKSANCSRVVDPLIKLSGTYDDNEDEFLKIYLKSNGFALTLEKCVQDGTKKLNETNQILRQTNCKSSLFSVNEKCQLQYFQLTEDYMHFLVLMFDMCFIKFLDSMAATIEPLAFIPPYAKAQKETLLKTITKDTIFKIANQKTSLVLKLLNNKMTFSSQVGNFDISCIPRESSCSTAQSFRNFPKHAIDTSTLDSYLLPFSLDYLNDSLNEEFYPLCKMAAWLLTWQDAYKTVFSEKPKASNRCHMKISICPYIVFLSLCLLQNKFKDIPVVYEKLQDASYTLHSSSWSKEMQNRKPCPSNGGIQSSYSTSKDANVQKEEFSENVVSITEGHHLKHKSQVQGELDHLQEQCDAASTTKPSLSLNGDSHDDNEPVSVSKTKQEPVFSLDDDRHVEESCMSNEPNENSFHIASCEIPIKGTSDRAMKSTEESDINNELDLKRQKTKSDFGFDFSVTRSHNRKHDYHLRRTCSDPVLGAGFSCEPLQKGESNLETSKPDLKHSFGNLKLKPSEHQPEMDHTVMKEQLEEQLEATLNVKEQLEATLYPQIQKMVQEIGIPLLAGAVGSCVGMSAALRSKILSSVEIQTNNETENALLTENPKQALSSKADASIQVSSSVLCNHQSPSSSENEVASNNVSDTLDEVSLIHTQQSGNSISKSEDRTKVECNNVQKHQFHARSKLDKTVWVDNPPAISQLPLRSPCLPLPLLQMPQPCKSNVFNIFLPSKAHLDEFEAARAFQKKQDLMNGLAANKPVTSFIVGRKLSTAQNTVAHVVDIPRKKLSAGMPLLNVTPKQEVYKVPSPKLIPIHPVVNTSVKKASLNEDSLNMLKEYQQVRTMHKQLQSTSVVKHLLAAEIQSDLIPHAVENVATDSSRKRRRKKKTFKSIGNQCMLSPLEVQADNISAAITKDTLGAEVQKLQKNEEIAIERHDLAQNGYNVEMGKLPAPFVKSFEELHHEISTALGKLRNPVATCSSQTDFLQNQDADTLTDEAYVTEPSNQPQGRTQQKLQHSVEVQACFRTSTENKACQVLSKVPESIDNWQQSEELQMIGDTQTLGTNNMAPLLKDELETVDKVTHEGIIGNVEPRTSDSGVDILKNYVKSTLQYEKTCKKSKAHLTKELERMQQKLTNIEQQSQTIKEEFNEAMQTLNVVDKALTQYESLVLS